MIFNKQVTEARSNEVRSQIYSLWNGWRPYQTNAYDLRKEAGGEWSKIDVSKLKRKTWHESWVGMPQAALEYIKSLPEFDAPLFKEITGLEISANSEAKKKSEELRKKADELLTQAKELENCL